MARAYLSGDESALKFYGGAHPRPPSLDPLIARLDAKWSQDRREKVVEMLGGQAADSSSRLEQFVAEGGFVVTTGQQAGFLTGPLYTITKALGAVAYASKLQDQIDRPVLPIFWVASEDHDWAEAESALLLERDGTPVHLSAPPLEEPANRPVFRVPLASMDNTLAQLRGLWPSGPFADESLDAVRDAYADGATLAQGCERLVERLLGKFGLFVVQAHNPVLKTESLGVLENALEHAAERAAEIDARGEALVEAGYHAQVTSAPGATNVLVETSTGRERVHTHKRGFRLGTEGPVLSQDQLFADVRADPSLATPDALLRPVVEASVFPVLAYVAGPGEIAYYAQNGPLYEAADVCRPHLFGRPSVTIVEPKVQKALDRINLNAPDLAAPLHELQTRIARDRMPPEVAATIERSRLALEGGLNALADQVSAIDPTMRGPVDQAGRRGVQSLARAEKKIMQAVKRRSTEALGHLDRARAGLYPEGKPQERAINVFHFLGPYGSGVIDALMTAVRAQVTDP